MIPTQDREKSVCCILHLTFFCLRLTGFKYKSFITCYRMERFSKPWHLHSRITLRPNNVLHHLDLGDLEPCKRLITKTTTTRRSCRFFLAPYLWCQSSALPHYNRRSDFWPQTSSSGTRNCVPLSLMNHLFSPSPVPMLSLNVSRSSWPSCLLRQSALSRCSVIAPISGRCT